VPASIHFADLTSPRARVLLDPGPVPVLLLPVGAVEPHGPHAPLGTDSIISAAVCERAAVELAGDAKVRALVLPEINFGVTRYSAAFTGAVTISETTLLALVVEICASLRAQGFRHEVIVNSHFEPAHVATLRQAAEQAKIGGTTAEPLSLSSSATDKDRLATLPPEGEIPSKIVSDQGCERPE